jgi:hypothetical protein
MGAPGLAFETWDPPRKGQSRILPIFKAQLFIRSEADLSRRAWRDLQCAIRVSVLNRSTTTFSLSTSGWGKSVILTRPLIAIGRPFQQTEPTSLLNTPFALG